MSTDTVPPQRSVGEIEARLEEAHRTVDEIESELEAAQRAAEAAEAAAAARRHRVSESRARLAGAVRRDAIALFPSLNQFYGAVSELSDGSYSPITVRNVLREQYAEAYAAAVLSLCVSVLAKARVGHELGEAV